MARGGKGVERAATEKKIAILERALHHHPGSERLLLALLEAAKVICDEAEMARRWRAVLEAHPDSPALWRAFLHSRLRAFSCFNAMEVEAQYAAAVRSVAGALALRRARGADLAELEAWERQLAGLALQGVLLMRQSGHTEAFVGSIQLLLEYTLCRPDDWPEDALPDMFPDYWAGRSPLLGEPGSRGWAAWLAGWQAAPAPVSATVPRREPAAAAAAPEEKDESGATAGVWTGLGLELEAALESGETMTDAVLSSWLESEESRSAAQWHPLRVLALDPGGEADPGCDGQRAVAWGRVSHLALPLGERVGGGVAFAADPGADALGAPALIAARKGFQACNDGEGGRVLGSASAAAEALALARAELALDASALQPPAALWLDGVALLLGATPARELGDLVDVMRGKQVALRTETLEAVLQQLESAPAAGMGEERPPVGRA
ncbi:NRDE2-like protein [Auxenochlorella protothecoides]|uniref:NRDE2-like protein n=1 Tax=Auxenochlorella protothecoides TaxID=3075 RepID=A0A087SJ27_AUXPR|nr:NRDE2-like protein [Auxenochlorella protothecoides]KFM25731.1 NRDE2-like protein [Auxenochlorella protothecoides]